MPRKLSQLPGRTSCRGRCRVCGRTHRTGDGSAELIAAQFGFAGVEEVARVEHVVANVLEDRAVEAVAAGFQRHGDDAAGEPAVFGGIAGGLQLEFLERFERRPGLRAGVARILIVEAIDGHVAGVGARAVDDVGRAFAAFLGGLHAGHHEGEIVEVAAVERHLGNLAGRDDVAAGRGFGIEQRDGRLHFDALADGAHLEHHVEARGLIDGEFQCGLARHLEAGLLDGHFVSAGRKAGDGVLAFRAGARSADLIRVRRRGRESMPRPRWRGWHRRPGRPGSRREFAPHQGRRTTAN